MRLLVGSLRLFGGGKEIRTPDFQLAKLALYQLSYTPMSGLGFRLQQNGGLEWTRTTDLTLIRRVL